MAAAEDFDVDALSGALNSSNKDQIISILCSRNLEQRRKIVSQFNQIDGIPLEQQLTSIFDGDSQKIMLALVMDPIIFYADEIYAAFEKLRTKKSNVFYKYAKPNYNTIANILCTLSNQAINDLKSVYNKKYDHTLEKDIGDNLSTQLKDLLLKICKAERDESESTDLEAARNDAKKLNDEKNPYNDDYETPFVEIFATRSFKQITLIIEQYKILTNEPIETRIDLLFKNEDVLGYITIVHYSEDQYYYYARCLCDGLKNSTLIGLLLLQCDNLIKVKQSFEINFGDSLRNYIKGKASKYYKYTLYTLFGETRSNG